MVGVGFYTICPYKSQSFALWWERSGEESIQRHKREHTERNAIDITDKEINPYLLGAFLSGGRGLVEWEWLVLLLIHPIKISNLNLLRTLRLNERVERL